MTLSTLLHKTAKFVTLVKTVSPKLETGYLDAPQIWTFLHPVFLFLQIPRNFQPKHMIPDKLGTSVALLWQHSEMCENFLLGAPFAGCQIVLHCAFCKYRRHAHLKRTMEVVNLLVVQPRWDFVQDTWKDFKNISKVFLSHFVAAHLITPPSCFTFISPVFLDSNAAKAFLNLKILSSDMKSAILTPQYLWNLSTWWFFFLKHVVWKLILSEVPVFCYVSCYFSGNFCFFNQPNATVSQHCWTVTLDHYYRIRINTTESSSPRPLHRQLITTNETQPDSGNPLQLGFLNTTHATCLSMSTSLFMFYYQTQTKFKLCQDFKFSQISCFQPELCSDVGSWYAKNSTDCSACVRCLRRCCVFLGIFVFLPGCVFNSPRLSDKIHWTSFRTFGKFCISWTLLTVSRPTYFCKFVSYCPIKFGESEVV